MWNPAREGIDFMMTAGPVEVSPRVLSALAQPTVYHYYPKFIEFFDSTTDKLAKVFRTKKENVLILQGEGVLGLEASIACTIDPGEKVLVFENGPFGAWFADYVTNAGGNPVFFHEEPNRGFDQAKAKAFLEQHRDAAAVTLVHCETPAGLLNDVAPICEEAKKLGMLTIVDCVASLAGADFRPDDWGVDISTSASQKCVGAPAALTPMTVSQQAWKKMESKKKPLRNSYLSLLDWKDTWLASKRFPFTPFTNDIYALDAALDEILEEGLDNCIARHADAAQYCRDGLKKMGLSLWPLDEKDCSPTVTTFQIPEGRTDTEIINSIVKKHRILMGGGYKELKGRLLRIATMGYGAKRHSVAATLDALSDVLKNH
jgi:aspartate aminotransferase-like enzyme